MILGELSPSAVARRLAGQGLVLQTGPFSYRIRSPLPSVAEGVAQLYGHYPLLPDEVFADFPVTIGAGAGLRRWLRPQARFRYDGREVFEPLPAAQAYPLLEWGMNWCISSQAHQYLILHAAVVERRGGALILPAPPGSGKSTLCAALVHAGWRLLSDELTLIRAADGQVVPLCRPVSLKNASIDVIRRFAPEARFNRVTRDTAKGAIAHMAVPAAQVARAAEPARPTWLVFPRYQAGSDTLLAPRNRAQSLVDLVRNAFNFAMHGDAGFELAGKLVADMRCLDLSYSRLDEATAALAALADTPA